MDLLAEPQTCRFDNFLLDREGRRLSRVSTSGEWTGVPVGSRAFEILCLLIDRRGEFVSRREIMETVWANAAVEESNLTVQMAALRRILDGERGGDSCIQTVPGRGYRFVLPVTQAERKKPQGRAELEPLKRPVRPRTTEAIVAASVVMALLAIGGWWLAKSATAPGQAQDRRHSVIVLPFENGSGDHAHDALAEELTRDLTDRLALARDGPVIPEITARGYRDQSADLLAIARRNDVHFALTGNVRRQDQRLIVQVAMYDTRDGQPAWSGTLDRSDGPDILTSITQVIYENCWQASVDEEAGWALLEHPDRLDARDLFDLTLSTRLATPTEAHFKEKIALVDRILALNPDNLQGLERKARLHAELVLLGYSSNPAIDLGLAQQAVDRMFVINPNNLLSMRAKATVLRAQGDWPGAELILRRAITLQPTEAGRHYELGDVLMAEGRHQEALASFQNARRFAGGADPLYSFDANAAMADLALGLFADAIDAARLSISEFPPDTGRSGELPWLALIAATSDSGNDADARADLQKFLSTTRNWDSLAKVQTVSAFAANPKLLDGLRQAGMPAR